MEDKKETIENITTQPVDMKKKEKLVSTEDETVVYKAERLFAKNWFIIAIFSIAVSFYALYVAQDTAQANKELKEEVRSNNLYVVFTTADGRSIKVQKTKIEPKYIEKWLARTLVDNLIVSRAELTDNYRISKFTSPADVIKNSHKLQFIYTDLMNKNDVESQKYLRTYLFKLQAMMAENTLPEIITINEYNNEYFNFNENNFSIKINAKVFTINYDISTDEKYEKIGVVPIEVEGYVDLSKSTELNPYGLIIKSFKIGVISKKRA